MFKIYICGCIQYYNGRDMLRHYYCACQLIRISIVRILKLELKEKVVVFTQVYEAIDNNF